MAAKERQLLFSVTIKDCDIQSMTAGGPGGQHRNRSQTAIRITHRASGATGYACDSKSQLTNKRAAFEKMANSKKFQVWCKMEAARRQGQKTPEQIVDELMRPENIRVECQVGDEWQPCGDCGTGQ